MELPARLEGDEVAAALAVDEEDPVAGGEGARHGRGAARTWSRQNAHTSVVVGAPHSAQRPSWALGSSPSGWSVNRSWAWSRKPWRNAALVPGERCSRVLRTSL